MPVRVAVSAVEVISPEFVMVIESPDGLFALMPRSPENAMEPLLSMVIVDSSGSGFRSKAILEGETEVAAGICIHR